MLRLHDAATDSGAIFRSRTVWWRIVSSQEERHSAVYGIAIPAGAQDWRDQTAGSSAARATAFAGAGARGEREDFGRRFTFGL